jgi:hypothetical protein
MRASGKTGAKNPVGRPLSEHSYRAKAAWLSEQLRFTVTVKMVREWIEKDYPIDDPVALLEHLNAQQRVPEGITPTEVARQTALEKLLKLRAERIAKDRTNAIEVGELISLAEYMEINAMIDSQICKSLDDLPVEMAPKVFGKKTVAEVTVKLREATDRIKDLLHAPIRTPSPKSV